MPLPVYKRYLPANRLFWHISGGGGLAGIFYDEGLTEINGFNKQSKRLQAINLLNPCSVTS
jgi:hypothetical protein